MLRFVTPTAVKIGRTVCLSVYDLFHNAVTMQIRSVE
jgi:hypothetical protein